MEKILVIMATYNGEKYLKKQLESIFNQRSVIVEVLVRDDGSYDTTLEILEEYQKKGKLNWYTGEHLNAAKGYMDLIKKSKKYNCDYIAFSDQDDVWDDDKLVVAVEALKKIPSEIPQLYYCGQRLVNEKLQLLGEHKLNKKRTLETRFILSDFAGCTGVFNKRLRDYVMEYEPSYILMHDTWILKVCLALGGEVVIDPEPHMYYRQHGNNTIGLGKSILAYIKQVRQYLTVYYVEPQMEELKKGYGDRIIPKYRILVEYVCTYRKNKLSKRKLLDKEIINFHNIGLNYTYILKVLLNKL